jgi:hypothetical protein
MSEYQYYEFLALDRAFTHHDIRELRKYSTRATITATRFVNHYEWGNFKVIPPHGCKSTLMHSCILRTGARIG